MGLFLYIYLLKRNITMKTILLPFFLLLSFISLAQTSKYGTFYEQRKSLFEILPDTKNEIVFLGNSITNGCEWSELFQNPNVKNRGISGDVTQGVLDRLDEVTLAKPAKVFLLIGINDLSRNVPKDSVFYNICKIADNIRVASPKTKIYIQSILPVNDVYGLFKNHTNKIPEIKWINENLVKVCKDKGYTVVDLFSRFKNTNDDKMNPKYSNDGLHLLGSGYLLWAEIIKPLL